MPEMKGLRGIALAPACALLASCTFLEPLDEYNAGDHERPADASDGSDVRTDGGSDAAEEGGTDASTDAASDADDGSDASSSFCASQSAAVCADFDLAGTNLIWRDAKIETAPPTFTQNGGTVELAPGFASPQAMRLSTPGISPGGGEDHAELKIAASHAGTALEYAFDVYVESADANAPDHAPVAVGGIEMGVGAEPYKLHVYLGSADVNTKRMKILLGEVGQGVVTGGTDYEFHFIDAVQPVQIDMGQWVRVFLSASLPAVAKDAGTATLDIEPAGQTRGQVLQAAIKPSALTLPTMAMSLIETAPFFPQTGWAIRIDDALLTIQ
jgi:hypothetical protein